MFPPKGNTNIVISKARNITTVNKHLQRQNTLGMYMLFLKKKRKNCPKGYGDGHKWPIRGNDLG